MTIYIEELNSKNNLIDEYFSLYKKYKNKYGDNTILLLQVGSFFEAYQTLDEGYNLQKLSDILNIIVSKKNKSIEEVSRKCPFMLGFPTLCLNKYLKILIDYGYIVIIGEQVSPPPNPLRAITQIVSKGTYIDDTYTQDSNNILSIYIEELDKLNLIIGLAILDISTGKCIVYEIYSIIDDEKICLDEAVRFMYSHSAKEIIITTNNLNKYNINDLLMYLEIIDKNYYHQTITQITGKRPLFKLSYQQEIFKKLYGNDNLLSPIENLDLENYTYARLSFIILLNYAYDHNHSIINNIHKPEIYNNDRYLTLGNNSIFQLNLLTFDKNNMTGIYTEKTQYKSLFDVLNKCITPMGRRFLKDSICKPLINIEEINLRYYLIEKLIENNLWETIQNNLSGINDIEKLCRKIYLNIINPSELYLLINSLSLTEELFNFILLNNLFSHNKDYHQNLSNLLSNIVQILKYISFVFNIEELQKYLINDIHNLIFNKNIYQDLDILTHKIKICNNYMDAIAWGLNKYLDKQLKTNSENLIKIDYNEREKHFLIITKRRCDVLEQLLKDNKIIEFEYDGIKYKLSGEELIFKHLPKGNNSKIFIKEVEKNSSKLLEYQEELKNLQKKYYIDILINITKKYKIILDESHKFISFIDYLSNGANIAIKYHYSQPKIINKIENKSYIDVKQIRHPIIELLNRDKEYIPNDVKIGIDNSDIILLYGVNGCGKSCTIKSVSLAIILAQMGYYVPCSNMEYFPYKYLYSRISSDDNIFKGYSSHVVELNELKAILKRSNENTIVIADEISKGTNFKSAIIIVASIIHILAKKKTSIITTTHIHELINIDSIKQLNNIKIFNLELKNDEINNIIIYNKKIKEGIIKNDFYGVDIARNILLNNEFYNIACNLKKELYQLSDIINTKISNYNSNLFMNECQICNYIPINNEIPLESHHIEFQKNFISTCSESSHIVQKKINKDKFHIINKNTKYNLICICKKCHDLIHDNKIIINGWKEGNINNKLEWCLS